jgi:hypothetical protein
MSALQGTFYKLNALIFRQIKKQSLLMWNVVAERPAVTINTGLNFSVVDF